MKINTNTQVKSILSEREIAFSEMERAYNAQKEYKEMIYELLVKRLTMGYDRIRASISDIVDDIISVNPNLDNASTYLVLVRRYEEEIIRRGYFWHNGVKIVLR